jgi:hypothetical protein
MKNCLSCKFYFITYDTQKPHGCRAMGFKSRQLPHLVVQQTSSGVPCLKYQKKQPKKSPPQNIPKDTVKIV